MTKNRNKAVPAVYLVLKKENQILMMRRAGSGYFDGWYSFPAGHVEEGELPLNALVRETKEEIGVEISLSDLELKHIMYRTKKNETGDRVDLFFSASKWEGDPKICELEKCDDLQWFNLNKLPENIVPYISVAIKNIFSGVLYSEIE